jgi:uncharacterized protein (DUF1015 family)
MANITTFLAIRPNPAYADQLIFTNPSTESIALHDRHSQYHLPLKTILETVARQKPETSENQQKAYQDILQAFVTFIRTGKLIKDDKPSLFVYEVRHHGIRQTGIWALTDITDVGKIKIHELTLADSMRRLKNYRRFTGLEGSPVLLMYPPDKTINRLIDEVKKDYQEMQIGNEEGSHSLWQINETKLIVSLTEAFKKISRVYLADGHHRLGSASSLALELRSKGGARLNTISTLYMALDQVQIKEYHRVVLPEKPVNKLELLSRINEFYEWKKCPQNQYILPAQPGQLGMCVHGEWYQLKAREKGYSIGGVSARLDAAMLQELILKPIFNIDDPKNDPKLKCVGGEKAHLEIDELCRAFPEATVFTLCPLTTDDLVKVADAGEVLPPKSTWINPKIPYGLILYQHNLS